MLSGLNDQQGVVWALLNLGVTARYRQDLSRAKIYLTHSLERSERIAYREGIAWSLNQLGAVSRLHQDYRLAEEQQSRSLEGHRDLGNRWRAASVLDELAAVSLAVGDPELATAQLGAADQLRRELGAPVPKAEQPLRQQTVSSARSLVGPAFPALSMAGMVTNAG